MRLKWRQRLNFWILPSILWRGWFGLDLEDSLWHVGHVDARGFGYGQLHVLTAHLGLLLNNRKTSNYSFIFCIIYTNVLKTTFNPFKSPPSIQGWPLNPSCLIPSIQPFIHHFLLGPSRVHETDRQEFYVHDFLNKLYMYIYITIDKTNYHQYVLWYHIILCIYWIYT